MCNLESGTSKWYQHGGSGDLGSELSQKQEKETKQVNLSSSSRLSRSDLSDVDIDIGKDGKKLRHRHFSYNIRFGAEYSRVG